MDNFLLLKKARLEKQSTASFSLYYRLGASLSTSTPKIFSFEKEIIKLDNQMEIKIKPSYTKVFSTQSGVERT